MAKLDHQVFAVSFVILCILWMSKGAKYRMIPGNFTMAEAPDKCQLATPELIYTSSGIQLNMTTGEFYLADGENFWTGYVKVFRAFKYRGCVQNSEKVSYQTRYIAREYESSPGTCFSFCGNSTVFGLSGLTCYCLPSFGNTTLNLANSGCKKNCVNLGGAICGARDGNFVSIYENVVYHESPSDSDNDAQKLCLALYTKIMTFKWSSCSDNNRYNCQQDKSDKVKDDKIIWSKNMEECLNDDNLPALTDKSYADSLSVTDTTLWIGEVRDQVIAIESSNSKDMVLQRGYIELEDEVFYLRFDTDAEHEQHNVLCYREYATVSSSSSSSSSITATDETATITNTTTNVTDGTFPPTTTASHEETTNDELIDKHNGLPLIVGVSVGVAVLVILIIIVVCVSKKRKKTNKKDPEHEIETRNKMRVEHNDASEATGRYFVLEPTGSGNKNEMSPIDDVVYDTAEERAPQGSDNRVYSRSDDDDTYNVTTDNTAKGKQPTENIYNKPEADDTYGHTGAVPRKFETDNVYNMTESGDIYNQAGVPPVRMMQTDNMTETDDTYSHTDRKPYTATATENVYN